METVTEHIRQTRAVSAVGMAGKLATGYNRVQAKLTVSSPGDAFERQADAVATRVIEGRGAGAAMSVSGSGATLATGGANAASPAVRPTLSRVARSASPAIMPKCASCEAEEKLQRKEMEHEPAPQLGKVEKDLKNSQGEGHPLPSATRAFMSHSIGADFSAVRIHTGARADGMNKLVNAKAFAFGKDIYFRQGYYDPGSEAGQFLLAHELTHVVQQGHAPLTATHKPGDGPDAPKPGSTPKSTPASTPKTGAPESIQRFSLSDLNPLDYSIDDLVRRFMPGIVMEIKDAGGILAWLEKKITAGLDTLMNAVIAPVKSAINFVAGLSPAMAKIITWLQTAGTKISKNDCSSFTELGTMVEQFVDELTAPAIEKVKEIAGTASDWCKDLWQKFGLPVWDFIKQYIGDQWETIKSIGNWIWEKSEPIRNWLASAWTKFKNWFGIGEGPEGQNGILQWVESKVLAVWETIKAKIEPFKKQLMVIGAVLVMLSPAGPLIAAGVAFALIVKAISWYRANIHSSADIVRLRIKFEKEILPSIIGGINKATAFLRPLFGGLIDKFNSVAGAMGKLISFVAGSILSFIQSALQWIVDGFNKLLTAITNGLTSLTGFLEGIFQKVVAFVTPIIHFLGKVADVVGDILQLPYLIAGALWKLIPACIRVAVEDFLLNTILKNVPFFEDIVSFIKYWQKIKAGVIDVIKTVFVTGDLKGGILKAFKLFLDVLGIPVELVVGIYNKAIASWQTIINKPKVLFGNIVQSIKNGFINFSKNFATNAIDALGNWIFSQVKGVVMPKEFTFQSIFGLVLDILGFTEDNIFAHIEKKTSKKFAARLRLAWRGLKALVKWVIDFFKDPKAAYEKLKKQAIEMKNKLFASIGQWIAKSVIAPFIAQITAELATTPFGEAIEAIKDAYQMIRTAVEYAEKILRIVDGVLDSILELAGGVLTKATTTVEHGLSLGLEVAVAFIAKILNIGDLPVQVKKIVEQDIRPVVDKGIDIVVDEIIAIVNTLKEFVGLGDKKDADDKKDDKKGDISVSHPLTLDQTAHAIIIKIENGKVSVLMASTPEDMVVLCGNVLSKLDPAKYGKDYPEIKGTLEKCRDVAREIPSDVGNIKEQILKGTSKDNTEERDLLKRFTMVRVEGVIRDLTKLAKKFKIEELSQFDKRVPDIRSILKPTTGGDLRTMLYERQCRWADIRANFLASGKGRDYFIRSLRALIDAKDLSGWRRMQDDGFVHYQESITSFNPEQHSDYAVDHKNSVANHWSKGHGGEAGNNTHDSDRCTFFKDPDNLRVVTARANSAKASEDGNYRLSVGPGFESNYLAAGLMEIAES